MPRIAANAQEIKTISGRVTDGKQPVELANVYYYNLSDSLHPLASTTTDSIGKFRLQVPAPAGIISIQLIGYLPLRLIFTPDNITSVFSSDLVLMSIAKDLNNVVVTANRKMVVKTPTGLVVRASESVTQAAGTVADLLAATPTVLVDAEGSITIRGKAPQVLINGRNSALAGQLDKLPASAVERIEINNLPSASNDAESEAGIINIVLKKNLAGSTTGAISGSIGAGAKTRTGGSLLLNQSANGWQLGLGYDNRFAGRTRTIDASRETFSSQAQRYLLQNRNDDRYETSHNLRLNADKDFNKQNSFSLEASYEYNAQRNDETLTSLLKNSSQAFTSSNSRFSHEIPVENAAELAATFTHLFKQPGRQLIAGISHSYERGDEQTKISTTPLSAAGDTSGAVFKQQTRNLEHVNISNVRADYIMPLKHNGLFETGYKATLRWLNTDFKSGEDKNGILLPDPAASNQFDFNEQIHAAYIQYRHQPKPAKGVVNWDAGLRTEYTANSGGNKGQSSFSNNYLKLFPTGSVTLYTAAEQWFRIGYARRINRPGLGALNPFVDITDSLNSHTGNPLLQPELVHSLDLGYNYGWTRGSISANAYYRNGTQTILQYTSIDSNGVALSRPENFGRSTTAGAELLGSINPSKWWNVNANVSLYHQQITGEKGTIIINESQWSWYAKLIANLNLWKGSKWQWLFNYQGPTAIPQGSRIAQYNLDMGLVQNCLKGKGRLSVTITDIFDTRRSGTNLSTAQFTWWRTAKADTRAILFTFGYSFGSTFKEKVMKNQFNLE